MATVKLLLCVLILLLVICRQDAADVGPLISVRPSNISFGLSEAFEVNCSFSGDRASNTNVVSLVLSRANDWKKDFTEIAAVTSFSSHPVTLLTNESVQADGLLSQTGESYLHLRWDYPSGREAGWYQCSLREVNFTGHCIVKDVDAHVNAGAPNLNDVLEAMQQMRREMAQKDDFVRSLEQQVFFLEQTVSAVDNYTKGIERERESAFEANRKLWLQNSSLSYKGKLYSFSKDMYRDIEISQIVCMVCGGTLAEMDDAYELNAVQNFLKSTSGYTNFIIGGSDQMQEGKWLLPSTGQALQFIMWEAGEPNSGNAANCLMLRSPNWLMADEYCHIDSPSAVRRFLCELPQ